MNYFFMFYSIYCLLLYLFFAFGYNYLHKRDPKETYRWIVRYYAIDIIGLLVSFFLEWKTNGQRFVLYNGLFTVIANYSLVFCSLKITQCAFALTAHRNETLIAAILTVCGVISGLLGENPYFFLPFHIILFFSNLYVCVLALKSEKAKAQSNMKDRVILALLLLNAIFSSISVAIGTLEHFDNIILKIPRFVFTETHGIFVNMLALGYLILQICKMKEIQPAQEENPLLKLNAFCEKYDLTSREKEVLELLLKGYSNKDIGAQLFLATGTIKTHTYNIYRKTNVNQRVQLIELFSKTHM